MEYKVVTRSETYKRYIDYLMPGLIKQLKLEKSRAFVLIEVCKDVGENAYGSTTNLPGLDSYVISLRRRPWAELGSTLAHEMVHVKQFVKGHLRVENGKKLWRGKHVTKRVKYLDQPWEREAFMKQEMLFRKAVEK